MKLTFMALLLSSIFFAQTADAQTLSIDSAYSLGETQPLPRPQAPRETQPVSPMLALSTSLGGLAGVAGGFGLAWGPALASDRSCSTDSSEELCGLESVFILMGTTWATPATTALGIWLAGRASGGRGNYGLTLLGSALGGTAGAGFALLGLSRESRGAHVAGFMAIPVLEWVGGLIAYHLSHNASIQRERNDRAMMPMVQVEQGGASLQLSGAF
ncbi:MAG: hypothetical protein AB8H86_20000 [Polyangiales bacterium]